MSLSVFIGRGRVPHEEPDLLQDTVPDLVAAQGLAALEDLPQPALPE